MKVIIFSHYGAGGALKYLKEVAGAFIKMGYPVEFYLPREAEGVIPGSLNSRFILKEPSISGGIFSKIGYLKFLHHLVKYLYNNLSFNPSPDCRVVHLLFPFYLTDLILLKRLKDRKIKVVITIHEVLAHRNFLGGRLDRFLISVMCKNADLILSHTEGLKYEMARLFSVRSEKIMVVPHGFYKMPRSKEEREVLRERYNLPADKKVLLFFGEIRENKGLDDLLIAFSGLHHEYHLLIAGIVNSSKEPSIDYYKDLIRRLRIEDRLSWIERYIGEDEIADIFKVSDAVALPYKRGFYAQSGVMSLSVGFEKPCIVTDVGGMGEVVKRYDIGIVVKPEDPEDIKEGIVNLFKDARRFNFDKYKQENNWMSSVEKMIKAYDEVISKN